MDKKKSKKKLIIILVVLLGVFYVSGNILVNKLFREMMERDLANSIAEQVEENQDNSGGETAGEDSLGVQEPEKLQEYASLYEQNPDLYGWIKVENTPMDYPVMFTPYDPEYYLHRDFEHNDSEGGLPFLKWSCYEGCGNYIIYGHHMKNGSMFTTVAGYEKPEFLREHPVIHFDTLYEKGAYGILGAFYSKVYSEEETEGFRYYDYTDLTDPALFEEYVREVKNASLYYTGIEAEYGDELITLSTCEYHTEDGRFVVVARKIRKGENIGDYTLW